MGRPLLCLLVSGLCLPAGAVSGPSLGVPEPPEVRRAQSSVLQSPPLPKALLLDERLARPVTLKVKRRPLHEALAEIARQTGAQITAARDIGEEPVVLFMHERPAREAMHHLAMLFDYRWRRQGERAWELYQDTEGKRQEQALRDQEEGRLWERLGRVVRHFQELCRRPAEALAASYAADQSALTTRLRNPENEAPNERRETEQDRARWRDFNDNWAAYHALSQPMGRALLGLIPAIPRAGWEALRAGRALYFDPDAGPGSIPMPPAISRSLAQATPTVGDPRGQILADLEKLQDTWRAAKDRRVLVYLSHSEADASLSLNLEPIALRDRSRSLTFGALGRLTLKARLQRENELSAHPDRVPPEWKVHPVAGRRKRVKLQPSSDAWAERGWEGNPILRRAELLAQLAEAYGIDLVADGYRSEYRMSERQPLPNGSIELPLYHTLHRWVSDTSDWSVQGEVLHVRHREWFQARWEEIPDSLASHWVDRLKRQPALSLSDVTSLLSLRDGQRRQFTGVMRERGIYLGEMFEERVALNAELAPVIGNREDSLLRAYAALPVPLKGRLERGGAVRYLEMPPAARKPLIQLMGLMDRFDSVNGPRPEPVEGELSLSRVTMDRSIKRGRRGDWLVEYALQPPVDPSETELWKTYLQDLIPEAQGVREPQPGSASGVRLVFRTRGETHVGCVPLPWAAVRDLAGARIE